MLIALIPADMIVADATPAAPRPFDLARVHFVAPIDGAAAARVRYRAVEPHLYEAPGGDRGVQIRIHGKKVRIRVPIPSI